MSTYAEWVSPAWLATATAWLDTTLAAAGTPRTGPVEQGRTRPWGTVLQAPTTAGPVWLKAPSPSLRFELPLLTALDGLGLNGAPRVLATDPELGLLLLADAGTAFRERWPDTAELRAHFTAAWPVVARLQRATAPRVPDLLAAGVADHTPTALPDRFDETLARARVDHRAAEAVDVLDAVAAARPRFVEVAAELAASGVAPSVEHDDLHHGNLAVDAAGRVTVLDWGDAVVAHPFATLVVAEGVLVRFLAADPDTVARARRGYLAVFAPDAPGEDLERTARLAAVAGQVSRAWVWQRALDTFVDAEAFERPPGFPADFDRGPLRHLTEALTALEELDR